MVRLVLFMNMQRSNITFCCLCLCVGANNHMLREYNIGTIINDKKFQMCSSIQRWRFISFSHWPFTIPDLPPLFPQTKNSTSYGTSTSWIPRPTNKKFNILWVLGILTPLTILTMLNVNIFILIIKKKLRYTYKHVSPNIY